MSCPLCLVDNKTDGHKSSLCWKLWQVPCPCLWHFCLDFASFLCSVLWFSPTVKDRLWRLILKWEWIIEVCPAVDWGSVQGVFPAFILQWKEAPAVPSIPLATKPEESGWFKIQTISSQISLVWRLLGWRNAEFPIWVPGFSMWDVSVGSQFKFQSNLGLVSFSPVSV